MRVRIPPRLVLSDICPLVAKLWQESCSLDTPQLRYSIPFLLVAYASVISQRSRCGPMPHQALHRFDGNTSVKQACCACASQVVDSHTIHTSGVTYPLPSPHDVGFHHDERSTLPQRLRGENRYASRSGFRAFPVSVYRAADLKPARILRGKRFFQGPETAT